MPLALTCDCGARFEVDEALAGQEVHCPECLQALKAPTRAAPPRTSLTALASVVLALVGAFTLVGTVAAVAVGLLALSRIRRQPERLCGAGYAVAGIAAGGVLTLVTLVALWRWDLVPVAGWVRRQVMSGQVDTTGALEVASPAARCTLTRPSSAWGRVRGEVSDDPAVSDLQRNTDPPVQLDLLLVHPGRHAFVDVRRDTRGQPMSLSQLKDSLIKELGVTRKPLLTDDDNPGESMRAQVSVRQQGKDLPPVDGREGREWVMEMTRGGQRWTFLVRAYRKEAVGPRGNDPIHIVRGYCLKRRFAANEEELRQLMDSIRFLD